MKLRWRAPGSSGPATNEGSVAARRGTTTETAELRGRAAWLLRSFLWIQAGGFLFYLVVSTWVAPSAFARFGLQTAFAWGVIILLFWAVRRGHVVLASVAYLGCGWLLLSLSAYTAGGIHGSATLGYLVLVVAAGLLLGTRATVGTALVGSLTALALAAAGTLGLLPPPSIQNTPLETWADFAVYAVVLVAFQLLAARNLRASESRYQSLVDRARDVIFTVSPEGRITSLNPAFEAVTGLRSTDWLGRPFVSLVAGERGEELWSKLLSAPGPALEVPVRCADRERVL